MSKIKTIEGDLTASSVQIALVLSRFNSFITDSLLDGALDILKRHGVADTDITVVKVPGAFELPIAASRLAKSGRFDGIIALGAVIRGGTPHFEYVSGECVKGLAHVSLNQDIPLSFGVLTVDSIEQAIERAGTKAGNKGAEAALSMLEMVSLLRHLDR